MVLRELVGQTSELLKHPVNRADPALARLFPDAYQDSAAESAEFRRLTEGELRTGKVEQAKLVLATLPAEGGEVRLDEEAAAGWLRALNDLRLLLGTRLSITDDTDLAAELDDQIMRDPNAARVVQLATYEYVTAVQDSLVVALADW
jgi:hypothetical protein